MVFYNIFLLVYKVTLLVLSPFHIKARKMLSGRRNLFPNLEKSIGPGGNIIWVHCASLGEFEQGRPVIEGLREKYKNHRVLLTFFSPSGYEVKKDYAGADWVFYMPLDSARNAKRFLELVKPSLVIFVKYEFWYYYLKKIKYRNIPLILVSALFRKDMMFFKWHGALARKMLSRFDHLFVQNESSKLLMEKIGLGAITTISGDTRFDRVAAIASAATTIPVVDDFLSGTRALIAGSTWPEDEEMLAKLNIHQVNTGLKLIIAPHEITPKRLDAISTLFPGAIRFSEWKMNNHAQCLVIDNMGMLSRLYKYAHIAYIGGGMRKSGVHNVLEAAVFGKPVLFGPHYKKYSEAIGLVEAGGGIPVAGFPELRHAIDRLMLDTRYYSETGKFSENFVHSQLGASNKIMSYIQENRLLTS